MNKDNEPRQSTAPIWCYALPGIFSFINCEKRYPWAVWVWYNGQECGNNPYIYSRQFIVNVIIIFTFLIISCAVMLVGLKQSKNHFVVYYGYYVFMEET